MRRLRALALAAAASLPAAAGAADLSVVLDQARVMPMPSGVTTVVIGNPMIADVTVQNGTLIVVTGKGYGVTNMMMLDTAGQILVEHQVRVSGPRDSTVNVWHGVGRQTYSCTPACERAAVLGDVESHFDRAIDQTSKRVSQSQGGGAASGGSGGK